MMFHECTFFVFSYTREHNTKDQPEWMALEPLSTYFSPLSHKRKKKKNIVTVQFRSGFQAFQTKAHSVVHFRMT